MKFNCGRYKDWRNARQAARIARLEKWHRKFVFYVRLAPNDCRICETVERRLFWSRTGDYAWMWEDVWEYRSA